MTDTTGTDPLGEARAAAQYWANRAAEIEGQQTEPVPESVQYAPPASRLSPREATQRVYEEGSRAGLREEDLAAAAVAELASGALAGDERYIYKPTHTNTVGGIPVG